MWNSPAAFDSSTAAGLPSQPCVRELEAEPTSAVDLGFVCSHHPLPLPICATVSFLVNALDFF